MPLLGSVFTHLILAVTLVLAAAVAGLMAYHYAKARLRERTGFTYDPETETTAPANPAEQRAKSAEEIAQIRARIEALMEQQQIRSETQSQHLAQKLDEIRTHMNTQDRKMDGLKSELRHEIRRRDSELDDLRLQLASALDAFWKSMPALPENGAPAAALPTPPEPFTDETSAAPEPYVEASAPPDGDVFTEDDTFAEEGALAEEGAFPEADAFAEDDAFAHTTLPLETPPSSFDDVGYEHAETYEDAPAWEAPFEPSDAPLPPVAWSSPFEEIPLEEFPLDEAPAEAAPPEDDVAFEEAAIDTVSFADPPVEETPSEEVPPFEGMPFDEVSFEEATFQEMTFEEVPLEEVPFEEADAGEDATEEMPMEMPTAPLNATPTEVPPPPAPVLTPPSWNTGLTSGDGSLTPPPTPASAPRARKAKAQSAPPPSPRPAPTAAAPAPPANGEDLTVITGITPEIQQQLYAAGVTALDEMARWSRADARRISGLVGVSEEIIMHQWIFEAQSVLFEQYQAMMTQGV